MKTDYTKWTTVVKTYDPNAELRVYINGVLVHDDKEKSESNVTIKNFMLFSRVLAANEIYALAGYPHEPERRTTAKRPWVLRLSWMIKSKLKSVWEALVR